SIGTNHQNLVAKQQDMFSPDSTNRTQKFRHQVLQNIGRLVLRTALDSLPGRRSLTLTTPYFLRPTMSNDRELVLVSARKSRGSNNGEKEVARTWLCHPG